MLTRRPDLTSAFVAVGVSPKGHPERAREVLDGKWPSELVELYHEHGEDRNHLRRLRARLMDSWKHDPDLGPEELGRLDVPTLVVSGDRDPLEPIETPIGLARALPRGELCILPGCRHFVMRERPEEFAVVLEEFLERNVR
jgi:pimeloyl-ACP methyl ester carboxylesterase